MLDTAATNAEKDYLCPRCSRGFARLEHLQRHERSHTKEKPFRCTHCPKAFTRKDLLSRHYRLSHITQLSSSHDERNASLKSGVGSPISSSLLKWPANPVPNLPTSADQQSVILSSSEALDTEEDTQATSLTAIESQYLPPHDGNVHDNEGGSLLPRPLQSSSISQDFSEAQFEQLFPAFQHDFASFMDSVPNLGYSAAPMYQPLPIFFETQDLPSPGAFEANGLSEADSQQVQAQIRPPTTLNQSTPTESTPVLHSSLSRYGSRLPSLQPEDKRPAPSSDHQSTKPANTRLFVSTENRNRMNQKLDQFSGCFEQSFVLPSRHALTRLICGYFEHFHDHYPFLHVPTLQLDLMNVDLVLAIAALGGRYTRESDMSVELFHVAWSVVMERIRRSRRAWSNPAAEMAFQDTSLTSNNTASGILDGGVESGDKSFQVVGMMQTLLLLIAIATWYKQEPAAADALSIRSLLHSLVWELDDCVHEYYDRDDWKAWVRDETTKRIQLVVFCFFNIHTILFDLPPMTLPEEFQVDLPCSEREWRAESGQAWREARSQCNTSSQKFPEAFMGLFSLDDESTGSAQVDGTSFSSLGGCALIHAIIQKIWLIRHSTLPTQNNSQSGLSIEEMKSFEWALKKWSRFWEQDQESSMNPLNPNGPVTFTSTALLRLAYIRLNMDTGPSRSLRSWDPNRIAQCLQHSPGVQRNDRTTRAALHCAHALSIPIKLGINYVAQTQVIRWSNQHALCSLECAHLLAKWLEAVTQPVLSTPLTVAESRVLDFIVHLVAEAEYKLSCEHVLRHKSRLAAMIVRVWAKLYQSSSVWQMVDLIGQSLTVYADILEQHGQTLA